MRLLYIDAYHQYINPTSGLLPVLVATAVQDVVFYGPGYSSDAELSGGIRAYVDRTGPYDGLVLGLQVPIFIRNEEDLHPSVRFVRRYNAFGSAVETLLPFFRDVLAHVGALPIRFRFISLLNFDYYMTTTRHTDVLDALDAYVITPGTQFASNVDELPDWAWEERHLAGKKSTRSSAWRDYLNRRADRVLSLPHFLAESEFFFRGLSDRHHRVSIPGVEYLMRGEGRKALKQRGISPARKSIFNLARYCDRLGIHAFSRYVPLKMYNSAYQGNLIDSRFVYTACDGFGTPVRKFFEIPAAGAVMMCISPPGFAELGFRDGENYLELAAVSLADTIDALERDLERAQTIASAGRKLVFDRHSLAARSRQFAQCFASIAAGRFAGSAWNKGEFKVLDRGAA